MNNVIAKRLHINGASHCIGRPYDEDIYPDQYSGIDQYREVGYEFINGLILLLNGVYPQFFEDRGKVNITRQTNQSAKLVSIEETTQTHEFSQVRILNAAWQAMNCFGDDVPAKYAELIPEALGIVDAIRSELRRLDATLLPIQINWDSWHPFRIKRADYWGSEVKPLDVEKTLVNWQQLANGSGDRQAWNNIVEGID